MFITKPSCAVSITIESTSIDEQPQRFFTKVYHEGKALHSEAFYTKAAADMAAEYFKKTYSQV
jgi:hypothetical protein